MTPNPNASPLAALIATPVATSKGVKAAPEIAGLPTVEGLDVGLEKSDFSNILQILTESSGEGGTALTLPDPKLEVNPVVLPGNHLAETPEAFPEILPGTTHVQQLAATDSVNGSLLPSGGNPLPPSLRAEFSELDITPVDATIIPAAVPPVAVPVLAVAKTPPPTYQGPAVAVTNLPLAEPVIIPDAIQDFIKMQKFKASQLQPIGPLSAAPVGVDSIMAATDTDTPGAEQVRLSVAPLDKANIAQATASALPLARPAGTPGWDQALGQRILWMVDNGLGQAELRLDPPHLGSVNVRIAMRDDQAQILFQAAHPAAREALETALPRLREMFADQGLQLGNADVGGQDGRATGQSGQSGHGHGDGEAAQNQPGALSVTGAADESSASLDPDTPRQVRVNEQLLVDEFV